MRRNASTSACREREIPSRSWPTTHSRRDLPGKTLILLESAVKAMAAAVGRLASEKQRILAALEADRCRRGEGAGPRRFGVPPRGCPCSGRGGCSGSVRRLADFAAAIAGRELAAGEAEAVLPGMQLRALAHLVLGNWRLFIGRKDEAAANFRAAWAALGAFDAPEHLCAWVEVGESLRRSYEGTAGRGSASRRARARDVRALRARPGHPARAARARGRALHGE